MAAEILMRQAEEEGQMKRDKAVQRGRRDFLKGMVVAGGAATAGVAVAGAITDAEAEPDVAAKPEVKRKGYHLTPHVRTYYDRARF